MATGTVEPAVARRTGRSLTGRLPVPTAGSPEGLPARRRWGRIAGGAVLALLGGWLSVTLHTSASDRAEVLVANGTIERFQTITADDLTVTRVGGDPTLELIGADELDQVVGRQAAVAMTDGSLLAPDQLLAEDAVLPDANQEVVPFDLAPGGFPGDLASGDLVSVVVTDRSTSTAADQAREPRPVPGLVADVGEEDDVTRRRAVDVVVNAEDVAEVAGHEVTLTLKNPENQ